MDNHTIRDGITFRASVAPLREPAFRVISALQDTHASVQIEATFLAGVLMAQSVGLNPHDLTSRALRQVADAEAVRTSHIDAIRDYAAGELK